jgi:hypothetical protein
MLRDPQHERKIIDNFKSSPFVLSHSKESERVFSSLLVSLSVSTFLAVDRDVLHLGRTRVSSRYVVRICQMPPSVKYLLGIAQP